MFQHLRKSPIFYISLVIISLFFEFVLLVSLQKKHELSALQPEPWWIVSLVFLFPIICIFSWFKSGIALYPKTHWKIGLLKAGILYVFIGIMMVLVLFLLGPKTSLSLFIFPWTYISILSWPFVLPFWLLLFFL